MRTCECCSFPPAQHSPGEKFSLKSLPSLLHLGTLQQLLTLVVGATPLCTSASAIRAVQCQEQDECQIPSHNHFLLLFIQVLHFLPLGRSYRPSFLPALTDGFFCVCQTLLEVLQGRRDEPDTVSASIKFSVQGSDKKHVPKGKCSQPSRGTECPENSEEAIPLTGRVR